MVFSDKSQSFKKVLLIQYPRRGRLQPRVPDLERARRGAGAHGRGRRLHCFVPTTPNPTSGFIIIVPRRDIIELDMEVDEALKMIISLGVVVPTWRRDQLGELPLE